MGEITLDLRLVIKIPSSDGAQVTDNKYQERNTCAKEFLFLNDWLQGYSSKLSCQIFKVKP